MLIAVTYASKHDRHRSLHDIAKEEEQTPAEDRQWKVVPKPKRKNGKKIHIYLDGSNKNKQKGKKTKDTDDKDVETQTKKAPELTTKSDSEDNIEWDGGDNLTVGASSQSNTISSIDTIGDSTQHHQHTIKEKIKIKVNVLRLGKVYRN